MKRSLNGCQKFGPDYARNIKRRQGRLGDMWHIIDEVFIWYCQLELDLTDWTCETHSVIPDNPMDSLHGNWVPWVDFC